MARLFRRLHRATFRFSILIAQWRLIADSRVIPLTVVEDLGVFKNFVLGVLPGLIALAMRQQLLQRVEETL